jgi:hypothetical protein
MDTNKMNLIKNNRGDKLLSVYWFAILLIVAAGIFAMVYVFYGTPYDVREIENRVLVNQVADCVSYGGKINSNLISNNVLTKDKNFLNQCHFIFNSSEWKDDQYYVEVNFYKLIDLNNPVLTINKGNNNWIAGCKVQEDKTYSNLVQCTNSKFYSLDDLNNQYIIKILGVVRKSEKNVKI